MQENGEEGKRKHVSLENRKVEQEWRGEGVGLKGRKDSLLLCILISTEFSQMSIDDIHIA
jgi:hypothetical protein